MIRRQLHRRVLAIVASAGVVLVALAPVARAQETGAVIIDDPSGALGDGRASVEAAAIELAAGSPFVISVVPSAAGRADDVLVDERYAQLLPDGSSAAILVLIVDERRGIASVRSPEAREVLADELSATSEKATEEFESGGAAAAALAGMDELRNQIVEGGDGGGGDSDDSWKGWLTWLIPVLLIVGGVYLFRALRARPLNSILERGVTPAADVRPGIVVVSGVATMEEPLISPLGQVRCLYWGTSWEETKQHSWTERGTRPVQVGERYNEDGTTETVYRDEDYAVEHVKTKTKTHTDRSDPVPFTVHDDTGAVVVIPPKRAQVRPTTTFKTDSAAEGAIPVDSTVTVVGPVELNDGQPQLRWNGRGRPSSRRPFLVAAGRFEEAGRQVRSSVRANFALAAACLAGIVAVLVVVAT